MAKKITWALNIQVAEGPRIAVSNTVEVPAYDEVEVVIPDAAADEEVEIQPGGADQVQFLLIRAQPYGNDLSYKVNDATADAITLDTPQLYLGAGAVALLGTDGPKKLLFSNGLGADATIRVFCGRKVTT